MGLWKKISHALFRERDSTSSLRRNRRGEVHATRRATRSGFPSRIGDFDFDGDGVLHCDSSENLRPPPLPPVLLLLVVVPVLGGAGSGTEQRKRKVEVGAQITPARAGANDHNVPSRRVASPSLAPCCCC